MRSIHTMRYYSAINEALTDMTTWMSPEVLSGRSYKKSHMKKKKKSHMNLGRKRRKEIRSGPVLQGRDTEKEAD